MAIMHKKIIDLMDIIDIIFLGHNPFFYISVNLFILRKVYTL